MIKNKKIFLSIISFLFLFFGTVFFSYGEESEEDKIMALFQEAINKNFREIDKQLEEYLFRLNAQKDYCFGPNKKMTFLECVDELEAQTGKTGKFALAYNKACTKSLEEILEDEEIIPANSSASILDKKYGICTKLYEEKLRLFRGVGYQILMNNKYEVLRDESTKMIQSDREKYSRVLDLARLVLGYMDSISYRWPSKTKRHIQ